MTSRKKNDAIVGVTVILVICAIIASLMWVNESSLGDRNRKISVRTRDVGGAGLGSSVVIRGVRSGRVDQIALGDSGWVVMRIALDDGVSLPHDPVVLISASSLFGEWQAAVMSLEGIPNDRELRLALLEASGTKDTLPGALLPDIAQLTAVAGRIAGDVANLADRVGVAFDDEAAMELRETFSSFSQLSTELKNTVSRQSKNLDSMGANVSKGIADLSAAAALIDSVARRVDASTSRGEIAEIVRTARKSAEHLLAATEQLRDMSGDVSRTQVTLESAISRADSVFLKLNSGHGTFAQLVNNPDLYQNSDSLVVELRALVADIRANPRRYFNLRVF